jgi:hypothetical protein
MDQQNTQPDRAMAQDVTPGRQAMSFARVLIAAQRRFAKGQSPEAPGAHLRQRTLVNREACAGDEIECPFRGGGLS